MTGRADRWIRWTTIGCVAFLALIAGTVSYLHMHLLVELHGQPGWVAALTPLSVDGMIVAASSALIASYELLMRQVRGAAEAGMSRQRSGGVRSRPEGAQSAGRPGVRLPDAGRGPAGRGREAQLLAAVGAGQPVR